MELTEKSILIAKRVPPGDQWCLVDDVKKIVKPLHDYLTQIIGNKAIKM